MQYEIDASGWPRDRVLDRPWPSWPASCTARPAPPTTRASRRRRALQARLHRPPGRGTRASGRGVSDGIVAETDQAGLRRRRRHPRRRDRARPDGRRRRLPLRRAERRARGPRPERRRPAARPVRGRRRRRDRLQPHRAHRRGHRLHRREPASAAPWRRPASPRWSAATPAAGRARRLAAAAGVHRPALRPDPRRPLPALPQPHHGGDLHGPRVRRPGARRPRRRAAASTRRSTWPTPSAAACPPELLCTSRGGACATPTAGPGAPPTPSG